MMMRKQFESLPEIKEILGSLHPTIIWFGDDNKYHTSFSGFDNAVIRLNGAWDIYKRCLGRTMTHVQNEITKHLKDHSRKVHNTSCTYQFELAFHRLQDTPELRKIYWSALGQLQFDSNDQVIPPELEECPCCEQPIIRKIGTETAGYETYDIGIDESGNRYIRHPHCEWEPEE